MMDLWQVDQQRQITEAEDERLAGETMDGLVKGIKLGKAVSGGLAGSLARMAGGMERATERKKGEIVRTLATTDKFKIFAPHAEKIMEQMKPGWWLARQDVPPEKVAAELVGYAVERIRREEKKQATARPSPENVMQGEWLSVPVGERQRAAVEKTVGYYCNPTTRPVGDFGRIKIKNWDELSPGSIKEYKKCLKQTQRELKELKAVGDWDCVAYLTDICITKSKSKYNTHRACIIQMAQARGQKQLVEIIQSIPPYKELCQILGTTPTPRIGEINRVRRERKDEREWGMLMNACSERYKDIIGLLRTTGARVCEANSIVLTRGEGGSISARIRTSKTGCRRKDKNFPGHRTLSFPPGTPENEFLASLLASRGNSPCHGLTAHGIQAAWARARKKAGLAEGQRWCLHALRHDYASRRKKEICAAMLAQHGADWRRRLYGAGWASDPRVREKYQKEVFGELAGELGHTYHEMVKQYG